MRTIFCAYLLGLNLHAQDLQNKLLNLQNPFLSPTLEQMAELGIQAIFPQEMRINNKWHKENDLIHDAISRRIDTRNVILGYDKQNITLGFRQNTKILID